MAYVFRRGWSKAYRRSRAPVVASGAIQITLNAAIGSFVATTMPVTFSGSLAVAAGALNLAGNAAASNTRASCGTASIAFTGMTAAFSPALISAMGSLAVAGINSRSVLVAGVAVGTFTLSGGAGSGALRLGALPSMFTVAGTASSYERDFEAWVNRPFDAVTWQPDPPALPSDWSSQSPSAGAWIGRAPAANIWTAAVVQSEPWTNE